MPSYKFTILTLATFILLLFNSFEVSSCKLLKKSSILLENKPLPTRMNLTTSIQSSFLDLFYNDLECEIEGTNSKLSLRTLKIENNQFCHFELVTALSNAIISFSLSRKEFTRFTNEGRYGELNSEALRRLRDYRVNDGEAGEILLYCFLEAHLNAPKILTKLELKTSSNDYVKGADGIHLLKLAPTQFQLVFGESKLDASLTDSITNAFKSISDFITRDKNNISHEIGLINTHLSKEAYDEEMYQFVKSIIYPSANSSTPIERDNAFAIFAGFEISITDEEKKLQNSEFRSLIRERIKVEVEKRKAHIKKKIEDFKLFNYSFYLYAFPFVEIDNTRKKIIEDLVNPVK